MKLRNLIVVLLAFSVCLTTLIVNTGVAHAAVVCHILIPQRPLKFLTTSWQLEKPCHESNPNNSVFLQAVIFDQDTKTISEYEPLVVDQGTNPLVQPVPITLPAHAVVAIFGGGNDDITVLDNNHGQCVNGVRGKRFGQIFFCGAQNFFNAVNSAAVSIPDPGKDSMGNQCPTIRSFSIVDQDQSDNVQTQYIVAGGRIAQNTPANRANFTGAAVLNNGSDNVVLQSVDSAIGCTPMMVKSLTTGSMVETQATNELQAAAFPPNPVAEIPLGDPMAGPNSIAMVNALRSQLDQANTNRGGANTQRYCKNIIQIQWKFLQQHKQALSRSTFINGQNLFTFLVERLKASLQLLKCRQNKRGDFGPGRSI